jgi:SHS2 domain-containing protein
VRRGYEFFDHTADIGAAVRGTTLPRLFENASRALLDLTCDRRAVRPRRGVAVLASGSSLEDLLVRWLSELLHLQQGGGWVFSSCSVDGLDRARLRARGRARGERFDPSRHRIRREVKAITYHQIHLARVRGAWRVRIVFDV